MPFTEVWQAMVFCAIAFAMYMIVIVKRNRAKKAQQPLKKLPQVKDWDDEWLEEEKRRHTVLQIAPIPLYFLGDRKKSTPGFGYKCKCGYTGHGLTLQLCEFNFEKHKKEEREKALAALGRFK